MNPQQNKPIEFRNMIRYLEKKDAVCKLIGGHGTGFFCKFKVNGRIMKALFTNNHVLNENLIKENSIIELRNKDEIKELKITSNRFKCTNKELDYTCIQILDNEDYNNFLEIDDNIKCQNPNVQYGNKLGVVYQFPDNQDISCGEGFIEGIKKVSDNLKVIGIHCRRKNNGRNEGIYFKNILYDIENK